MLVDKFGRRINYLRLSVTDRCNLRCSYCMPEHGMKFSERKDLLTYEEILKIVSLLGKEGVNKIRLTGGEPFVRRDLINLIRALKQAKFLRKLAITTNITLIQEHIEELERLGVWDVNVSLDAVERKKFHEITRRDEYDVVKKNLDDLIKEGFEVKINCVVMKGKNEDQILPMIELAKENENVDVRFLEEMPFNGSGVAGQEVLNYQGIIDRINARHELFRLTEETSSTAQLYTIPGYLGKIGIIPSYSRTFCGDCNRLRLSATGDLRTCLYGQSQLNLRDMLRGGSTDHGIIKAIKDAVIAKPISG